MTPSSVDVVVVADSDDRVATRLQHLIAARGKNVVQLDGSSAARMFTIRVKKEGTTVLPCIPMFVRASAWWNNNGEQSADARFQKAEEYATFWSAAALSTAPVVNRPTHHGPIGRITAGGMAGILGAPIDRKLREVHTSGPEVLGFWDDSQWGEDVDFVTAPVSSLRSNVPMRARNVNTAELYEIVTVVGNRGFSATEDRRTTEFALIERSIAAVQKSGAHFATVTWAVHGDDAAAVRMDAEPNEADLHFAWTDVANALIEDLFR